MLNLRKWTGQLACVAVLLLGANTAAMAQASRTWVSGVGDDANPCSRTAPCKTFAGAISKTAAGGEISVLDPGGFGAVTITKSITINNNGGEAGILAASVNGITINAAATDRVTLKGLTIEGFATGFNGIRILSAAEVVVDDCLIEHFRGSNPSSGILMAPSAGWVRLTVRNSTIAFNGQSTAGNAGILLKPTGSAYAIADINNTVLANNASGLIVDASGTTGGAWATVRDSQIQGNYWDGALATSTSSALARIALKGNTIADNGYTSGSATASAVKSNGSTSHVRIQDNVITANRNGVLITSSGVIWSYGDNIISANTTNGTFTSTEPTQ